MSKNILLFITLFILTESCKKDDLDIVNLNGNKITCMGHGGMGISSTYPMNSCESILKCLSLGADGTEFDVQMTKDSVLVLFHDRDLSGQTNLSGLINSFNWSELQNVRYTTTLYLKYSIISLEQLFSSIQNIDKYVFTFDCKLYTTGNDNQFYATFINAIINMVEKHKLKTNNICIESQSTEFLKLFKQRKPEWQLFIYPSSFDEGLQIARNLNLFGITISTREISAEQMKIAHANNLRVAIWNTHSDADNRDGIKKNPDYIQTDRVKDLVKKTR